jgi:hypothetical protein
VAEQHRVAVVVFCTADGVDDIDARIGAEAAVRHALRQSWTDGVLQVPLRSELGRTVQVHAVSDAISAALNGELALRVTNRAYPRKDPDA